MKKITTIVHFSMPTKNMDEFFDIWRPTQDIMAAQPGAIGNIMHRAIDTESPFQFVNVAIWEDPDALQRALKTSIEGQQEQGIDIRSEFARLGVSMSQSNYVAVFENSNV